MLGDDTSRKNENRSPETTGESERDESFAYRDVNERLPNESLREELEGMTPEEREAYLRRLEDLAKTYIGPGGP